MNSKIPKIALFIIILTAGLPSAFAQRVYTFSFDLTAQGATDDNPRVANSNAGLVSSDDFNFTYSVFPSISMESVGAQSSFQAFYALGLNRFNTSQDLDFESHHLGFGWQARLSERWTIDFSETLIKSPDLGSGLDIPDLGFPPEFLVSLFGTDAFDPIILRRDSYYNTSALTLGYTLSPSSDLSFGLGHVLRTFEDGFQGPAQPIDPFGLSDQNRFSAFARYTHNLSPRSAWNVRWSVNHFDFKEFENARTYALNFGFNHQLTPKTTLSFGAGPSFTDSLGLSEDNWGYNAHVTLVQTLDDINRFRVAYRRTSGDSTGAGSLSDTHNFGVGFERNLLRNAVFEAMASYYDSQRQADNPIQTDGITLSLALAFPVTDNWRFRVGTDYFNQNGTSAFDLDRTRFFVSVMFSLPEFWRFQR